jgi:cyclase
MRPTRREFLASSSIAIAGAALGVRPAFGQAGAPATQATSFEELRNGIGLFTGRGGTIGWYVSPEGVVAVDAQFPDMAAIFLERLNARSSNRAVDVLFNTHHHGDHTAGNVTFKGVAKQIVAHVRVPELQRAAAEKGTTQPPAPQVYADTTFDESWSASFGNEKVVARYFGPAHTGGDSIVLFERANVVHMGDLVFNRRHPFIDKPAGASVAGWIEVLEKVAAAHPDALFIYGHAGEGWKANGGREDLLYQRDYLSALLEHVRAEMKAGKPREEIVKSTAVLKGFPDHGPLIERVLAAAHEELAGK